MKIFIDTANLEEIRRACSLGIVDGVTTNPSLIAKEKTHFETLIEKICATINGPVSVEVIATEYNEMIEEAKMLANMAENIVVKIPITEEGLKTTAYLSKNAVKVNMTLIFSANQALLAAKAGACYVSPFVGRIDDISYDGMSVVREISQIFRNYSFSTEIIAASIRHPLHVIEAAKAGAHIATIPFAVIDKMIKHPLTDIGLKKFLDDWKTTTK